MSEEERISALSFEEALAELEEIVTRMEDGELSLEESLGLYERGQALARHCNRHLETATLRVEQLTATGEIVEVSVEE
jgi:exodeoxyribonuclease VII small subunit